LQANGADPAASGSELGRFYHGWIDLHTDDALGPIVRHLESVVDQVETNEVPKLDAIFERALRYEVAFWDMAYEGENWPQ